jgi:hypothetical protein
MYIVFYYFDVIPKTIILVPLCTGKKTQKNSNDSRISHIRGEKSTKGEFHDQGDNVTK